jgi:phosphohistidine phosphatase
VLRVYLIRHAEAVSRDDADFKDGERPLVDAGREAARELGRELLARGVRFDVTLTSPHVRAAQTADELAAVMGDAAGEVHVADELAPGRKARKLDRQLLKYDAGAVALIGHQPDLGDYAARLIGAEKRSIKLAKCGAALVQCDEAPCKGCGELVWLLTPGWLGIRSADAEPVTFAAVGV